jgi:hypothetical protein
MPLQQMQVERKRDPRESGEEPGREESHLITASAQRGANRPIGQEQEYKSFLGTDENSDYKQILPG